jgi:hypothetical protein
MVTRRQYKHEHGSGPQVRRVTQAHLAPEIRRADFLTALIPDESGAASANLASKVSALAFANGLRLCLKVR